MKLVYKLLLILSGTILFSCFLTLNNLKPQVNSEVAIAQRPPGMLDTAEIMKRLRNGSKVTYRTAKLRHQNTNTTAYLEVTLTPQFDTEAIALIIENNGQTQKLPRNFGFPSDIPISLSPVAFSPDGRYLIIDAGQMWSEGGGTILVDLKNNYQTVTTNLPEIADCFGGWSYGGFIATEEIVFSCNMFDRRLRESPKIVLNLNNGSFRNVSRQSFDLLPETSDRLAQPSIL
jgi:hypothetical protein